MIEKTIWTVLAVGALAVLFAVCVFVVTLGLRWMERALARRRG